MQLREATPSDIPAMLAIEQAATSHPWTEALFVSCFGNRYFNRVAVQSQPQGDVIVGFYIGEYIAGEASLFDIAVHPSMQRLGIGRLLLQDFIEQAVRRGAEHLFLEVRESNSGAIALYEAAGFAEAGRRHNYYPHAKGYEDALLMCFDTAMLSMSAD